MCNDTKACYLELQVSTDKEQDKYRNQFTEKSECGENFVETRFIVRANAICTVGLVNSIFENSSNGFVIRRQSVFNYPLLAVMLQYQ